MRIPPNSRTLDYVLAEGRPDRTLVEEMIATLAHKIDVDIDRLRRSPQMALARDVVVVAARRVGCNDASIAAAMGWLDERRCDRSSRRLRTSGEWAERLLYVELLARRYSVAGRSGG